MCGVEGVASGTRWFPDGGRYSLGLEGIPNGLNGIVPVGEIGEVGYVCHLFATRFDD